MLEKFDYATYDRLLKRVRATHANLRFCDLPAGRGRWFVLRHDVDFAPAAALALAQREAQAGVRATYFLLLSAETYNLQAPEHTALPRRLVELGHEVGLHYDAAALEAVGPAARDELVSLRLRTLEALAGAPVRSIALHNPSLSGADPLAGRADLVSAYDPAYTRDIAYFSDSCGAWRNDAWRALTAGPLPDRFQLLVHPLFWAAEHADRWARLDAWQAAQRRRLDGAVQAVRRAWSEHAGVREHEARGAEG